MARESDTAAESTMSVGRSVARFEPSSNDPAEDALLKDSMWSMASTGLAFQRPTGEIPNGSSTPREGALSQPDISSSGIPKYYPITRFGLPSKIINEAISPPIEKTAEPTDAARGAEFPGATLEQRQKFLDQLDKHMSAQQYHSQIGLASFGAILAAAATFRASTPVGLGFTALGLGASFYGGYNVDSNRRSAGDLLKQMPQSDSERFGKYQSELHNADINTTRGYLMGAGLALVSMAQVTKYINPNTSGLALLAGIGNNVYQTQYSMPKTLLNFRTDVESWKQEQAKK
ncbi:MAG: hypothetical protein C0469_17705 [Cyanobacteria bacterium DS2.3.42]|nr:hypothetical protein [Cyanobacteria bacterium DS2.3.42]